MEGRKNNRRERRWWSAAVALCACGMFALTADVGHVDAAEDLAICDQVEDELFFDQAVTSAMIDVTCSEGIVTLEGSVTNLLEKERAQKLAETVRGVRSIVNLIEVRPDTSLSDDAIEDNIEVAWWNDPATESYEVDVDVHQGKATLTGTVDSWQERQLSEYVAKGVAGVVAVDNRIAIDYPDSRIDSEIEHDVRQALRRDVFLDGGLLIDLSVEDGEVLLTGTVGSAFEKQRARTIAWVTGVKNVDASQLKVEDWVGDQQERDTAYPTLSDSEVVEAVNDALLYDPRTNSFNVDVSSINGYVTLRGQVDNLKAKRAAEQDARSTIGVHSVSNRLKVRSNNDATDAEIRERIEEALLRNPYTDSFEISVIVNAGIVDLYGTVDTAFEKAEADDVAARVNGVVWVDNNLLTTDEYQSYLYDPLVDGYDPYSYDWYDFDPRTTFESDTEIKQSIEDELWWSPFVDANQVTVSVVNGEATLTGTVDSRMELQAAAENAIEGGATSVDNDLVIR